MDGMGDEHFFQLVEYYSAWWIRVLV